MSAFQGIALTVDHVRLCRSGLVLCITVVEPECHMY